LTAPFWNPVDGSTATVEVQDTANHAVLVTVRWDPVTRTSAVLATCSVAPK
jgi:hypothetical protein